jgi:hypothetical protein
LATHLSINWTLCCFSNVTAAAFIAIITSATVGCVCVDAITTDKSNPDPPSTPTAAPSIIHRRQRHATTLAAASPPPYLDHLWWRNNSIDSSRLFKRTSGPPSSTCQAGT